MTRTTIATALTTTALAAALLSGCGGSGDPSASGSSMPNVEPSPSSSASSTTPSPSSSSAPSSPASSPKPSGSVEMAGAPGVPKAARHHTKAGAKAFIRHYFRVVNETGLQPKKNRLEPLATENCASCHALSETVATMVDKGQHYSSKPVKTGTASIVAWLPRRADVQIQLVQMAVTRQTNAGVDVERIPHAEGNYVSELRWTTGGWRVNSIFTKK